LIFRNKTGGMGFIDFFIVGVQKGGTTALDSYLRQSPFVQMADVKEVHFFDNESLDWSDPAYLSFHEHFEWSQTSGIIRGEATPIYMYWPYAMERILRYNAAAKLIVCLRHPSYRAHSHWRMETMRSAETLPFEDAISEAGRRRVRYAEGGVHRVYSYVERGFYAPQIRRLRQLFPPEQLLFLRTDDLWTRTKSTLSRVYRFLNLAPSAPAGTAYIVPVRSDGLGTISETALLKLNSLFEVDINETSGLTGLSLADWMEPDYREPMAAP
jgi:hypothetical protein